MDGPAFKSRMQAAAFHKAFLGGRNKNSMASPRESAQNLRMTNSIPRRADRCVVKSRSRPGFPQAAPAFVRPVPGQAPRRLGHSFWIASTVLKLSASGVRAPSSVCLPRQDFRKFLDHMLGRCELPRPCLIDLMRNHTFRGTSMVFNGDGQQDQD